jgi:hypothetical protein
MRTASEPVRGIFGGLLAGLARLFVDDFLAAVFLLVGLFLALDLRRSLLTELVFFVFFMRLILPLGGGIVKAESWIDPLATWRAGDERRGARSRE